MTSRPIVTCPLGRLIDRFTGDQFGYYVLPQFRADVLSIGALAAWRRLYGVPDAAISSSVKSGFLSPRWCCRG
jgi:hypothetical protein